MSDRYTYHGKMIIGLSEGYPAYVHNENDAPVITAELNTLHRQLDEAQAEIERLRWKPASEPPAAKSKVPYWDDDVLASRRVIFSKKGHTETEVLIVRWATNDAVPDGDWTDDNTGDQIDWASGDLWTELPQASETEARS